MDKKKISKDYLEKIKLLEAYNKNYYDNNSPIISDQEYDFFKKKIIDLENSYKFLNNKNSPSKIVGFKPSKNFEKTRSIAIKDQDFFEELINILIESIIQYLSYQIESGVEVIQLFDYWAGILPENQFKKWVLNPNKKIIDKLFEGYSKN